MIPKLVIVRLEDTVEDGTFGVLLLQNRVQCWTLELPWRNNAENVSCIPTGLYVLSPRFTWRAVDKHGPTYQVDGVPSRTGILFHPANVDEQLLGCIAVGETIGKLKGDRAILNSGKTFHYSTITKNIYENSPEILPSQW